MKLKILDWRRPYITFLILVAVFALTVSFVLPYYYNQKETVRDAQAQISEGTGPKIVDRNILSLPDLFTRVKNSVVQVSDVVSTLNGEGTRLGSGFIYDNEGHIITNYHVVQTSSRNPQFDVAFSDGNSYSAQLIGSDPYSDLAVLKLEGVPAGKLVPLTVANPPGMRVGDTVIAIGNPFGLAGSMTTGIVSGLSRILPSDNGNPTVNTMPLSFSIPNIIQTDAAINPGNSGGPLLNSRGEVIGINTAIYSNTGVYSGVGFAIPSDTIMKIVPSLIKTGTYQHPYLGVAGVDVTPRIARQLGLEHAAGFLITGITSGGPADKYGLHAAQLGRSDGGAGVMTGGDIITKIDNQDVKKIDDVLSYLESHSSVGDTVHLVINRNGVIKNLDVVLDARPTPNKLQNVASEQSDPNFGPQSGDDNGNLYNQCKKFAGQELCGFFFGK
jgi:S1-C subfamily serine protease